jgi:hypothetical protein
LIIGAPAECIGDDILFTGDVIYVEVVFLNDFHPSSLASGIKTGLGLNVFISPVVGEEIKLGAEEVVTPNTEGFYQREEFLFMSRIVTLCTIELSRVICYDPFCCFTALCEYGADADFGSITLDSEREGGVRGRNDGSGDESVLESIECYLL